MKIVRGGGGRREVQRGEARDQHAIHFFGKRLAHVAGAQPGFDMRDGNAAVERRERAAQRSGGIALDQNVIRPLCRENIFQSGDDRGRGFKQGLAGPHQVEVVVGRDREGLENLVEQAAMLRRGGDPDVELAGPLAQRAHHRRELDRFGPRAEDEENFLHAWAICGGK